jgi:hypothetical protein
LLILLRSPPIPRCAGRSAHTPSVDEGGNRSKKRPNRQANSIAEHSRDPLMEVERTRFVEERLTAFRKNLLDHLFDGIIESRGPFAGVGE